MRSEQPLRFPVQDVYKFDARRILAGRITAGRLKVGDHLVFSPSNKRANIRSVEAFNIDPVPTEAEAGQSVGITLDEQIFVERGEIATHQEQLPLVSTAFRANLFWLGKRPLETGRKYHAASGHQGSGLRGGVDSPDHRHDGFGSAAGQRNGESAIRWRS